MTARLDRLEQFYTNDHFYQDVKKSLFYPNIYSRQEQIAYEFDGIEDSYDWIFTETSGSSSESDDASTRTQKDRLGTISRNGFGLETPSTGSMEKLDLENRHL